MKRKVILLILVMVLLLSQGVGLNAQEQGTVICWITGNDYLKMSEEIRTFYVAGLCDMFNFFLSKNYPEAYKIIEAKIKEGITLGQMQKIFGKYLAEHPENLHYTAASIFFWAIIDFVLANE